MKRSTISICPLLVLTAVLLSAQDNTPAIVFDSAVKDMGKVTEGEVVKHVFKFTNKGRATLEVLKVEPACGCTAAVLSSKQIAPGQSGEIEVSIKTEGMTALNKTVAVATNDPKQPQITLTVSAAVEPEFQLSDRSVYFGNNPRGKEVIRELLVTAPAEKHVKFTGVDSTDQAVLVRMEPVAGSNGKKLKVIATQKADAKDGYHFGFIVVKTTSSLTPELKVPIRGMVAPPTK